MDHSLRRFDTQLRVTSFGRVELIDWLDTKDVYRSRRVVDVAAGYRATRNLRVTLGAANLLNEYPTQQDPETETGGLWDAVQMGFSGRFYFARVSASF